MGGGFSLSQVIINTSWELKGVGGGRGFGKWLGICAYLGVWGRRGTHLEIRGVGSSWAVYQGIRPQYGI
jgi:hypothetical protein